ncbi:OsmC family protein [Kerstersia sp.]|uniref:OsmC family protein n=1 Tax=Kerstersia sp. TaxID=1930783 RepID=UPI003F902739
MSNQPYLDAQALADTIAAVSDNPNLGRVTFSLESTSGGGLRMQSQTGTLHQAGQADGSRRGRFSLQSDEPVSLLGTDSAVSPAEYVLQGLAGCYGVTLAACAAKRGLTLRKIDLDLDFDVDLNGFLGIDRAVRPGAQEIRVQVRLDCPGASAAQLQDLMAALEQASPIRDTLANPVKVTTRLAAQA